MPLSKANMNSADTDFDDDFDDDLTNASGDGKTTEVETNDTDVGFTDEQEQAQDQAQTQAQDNPTPQTTVPAQAAQGGAMTTGNPGMGAIDDDGLGEMDIGFGSFPIVKLQEGEFQTNDGTMLGKEFDCQILSARPKYIYKVNDNDLFYTYDQVTTTKGENVADKVAVWKQANETFEVKEYVDVTAMLVGGELEGQVVILSLPPTTKKRFSGYRVMCQMKHKAKATDVITRVYRGEKVTRAVQPFYPWEFAVATDKSAAV